MKFWRCVTCEDRPGIPGHDFAAEQPVCDRCGTDAKSGGLAASKIIALKVLHFDAPDPVRPGRFVNAAACDIALTVGKVRLTGEPSVVNCPACKMTQEWKTADAASRVVLDEDFPIQIDTEAGVIRKA